MRSSISGYSIFYSATSAQLYINPSIYPTIYLSAASRAKHTIKPEGSVGHQSHFVHLFVRKGGILTGANTVVSSSFRVTRVMLKRPKPNQPLAPSWKCGKNSRSLKPVNGAIFKCKKPVFVKFYKPTLCADFILMCEMWENDSWHWSNYVLAC